MAGISGDRDESSGHSSYQGNKKPTRHSLSMGCLSVEEASGDPIFSFLRELASWETTIFNLIR
jgi:hypothetical protein